MANELFKTAEVDFSKPLDVSGLKGQTAIVTGAASGIGEGIARALAAAGTSVLCVDKSVEAGEAIAADLQNKGFHAKFVAADVASYDSQLAAFKAALAFSPNARIDIVVPAAGITAGTMDLEAMPKDLPVDADPPAPNMQCLDINLYGVFYSTHLAIHYFKKDEAARGDIPASHRPQILFVSSLSGYGDHPLIGKYSSAKWGVRGLWRAVRGCSEDLGGMRANLLAPTFLRTGMTEGIISRLLQNGVKVGAVADAVDGALRCLSDETVEARAIAIGPGEMNGGTPGSANFDLCDDILDHDAGKVMLERGMHSNVLGEGFADTLRITKKGREGPLERYGSE